MNTLPQTSRSSCIVQQTGDSSNSAGKLFDFSRQTGPFSMLVLLTGMVFLLFATPAARAHESPPGCTGSGLGISLFADRQDVHIGEPIRYSILVFNTAFPACDATGIRAFIVTPDGITNTIALRKTALVPNDSDFYTNVVIYVVRPQDVRADGTVRATASDDGDIHQNDTDSRGGGNQGVNTEVPLPCLQLLAQCVGAIGENGAITFTATVKNCGNVPLFGVTVTNLVNNTSFLVLGPTNIATNQIVSFSGSWVPLNPCVPSTAILAALASDAIQPTPSNVVASVSVTCANVLTPGIHVTKLCPPGTVSPGQSLVYSGSVSNTGNVTLTNIVVVDDHPAANTTVFTLASLAPGAVANFIGNYLAPTNCSTTDTLTARASSVCGVAVTDTASATCPILTTPQITVTVVCSTNTATPGGVLSYGGTVSNVGNITLNNVVVVSDHPGPNTVVFTAASLAPGASANFTGNFTVAANACSVTTTLTASGKDICTTNAVSNTASVTCPITSNPRITVTLACPAVSVAPGGLITYTGTVSNPGNVTLNNVVVANNQPAPNTVVLSVASLAPGASANFTATVTAPADACSVSSTVTASGSDSCSAAVISNNASATCPLVTTPRIVVTQNCPPNPVSLGGVLNYSGSVSNAGNITLTNVVVVSDRTGATPVFTAATLAPGEVANFPGSFTVPAAGGCSITSTLTASASDKCNGTRVTANTTTTCPVVGTANVAVTLACPANPVALGGVLTFSGTVSNPGNITLTNVIITSDLPAANTVVFSRATLAPGASATFTGSYTVAKTDACSVTTTVNVSASDQCIGSGVVASASATCPLITAPRITVTQVCPPTAAVPGGVLAYTGTVSNPGNVTLTNITVVSSQPVANTPVFTVASLAPGASANFSGSFTTPLDSCAVTSTLVASGNDQCTGNAVNNNVTTTCPLVTSPQIAVTKACPVESVTPGGTLVFTGTVTNTGNVTLTGVVVVNSQPAPNTTVFGPLTLAPGAGASFSGSYRVPANFCSVTDTLTATGKDKCTGTNVSASATSTCPVLTSSRITVTHLCPAAPVAPGSLLTYSGTVGNAGNVTLTNIVVVDDQNPGTPVFTLSTLAAGATANFTGKFTVPATAVCEFTSTVTASAADQCGGNSVTASAPATCPVLTTPRVTITQECPPTPVGPGGTLTVSGTVSNTGNVTLTNVTVFSNQAVARTTGGAANSAAVPAAATGLVGYWALDETSGSTATDGSGNGNNGTINNATRVAGQSGNALDFDGTRSFVDIPNSTSLNFTGSITLAAWIQPDSRGSLQNILAHGFSPSPVSAVVLRILGGQYEVGSWNGTTTVLASAPMPAGDVGNFVHLAGVYDGSSWTLYRNGVALKTAASPLGALTVNQNWAIGARGGGLVQFFNGVIDEARIYNRGLSSDEILVLAGQPANPNPTPTPTPTPTPVPAGSTPVFNVATLAPGAVANFTVSYTVPTNNACTFTSTLTVSGNDQCTGKSTTGSVSTTCPVLTAPKITVTKLCPPNPVAQGALLTFSGTVHNSGNITLNNIVVVNNQPVPNTAVFTLASLAPGATANFTGSYKVPGNCCSVTDTLTASGKDACTGVLVTDTATETCPVLFTPRIAVTKNCSTKSVAPGELLTYTGTVNNPGNITLVNVTVVDDQPNSNTPVIGPIALAPGETVHFTGSYIVPTDFCGTDTLTARGSSFCGGSNLIASATSTCPVVTTPGIAVAKYCPATPVPRGGLFVFTGTVTNTGNVTLNNVFVVNNQPTNNTPVLGPITLAAGTSTNFTGSYIANSDCCAVIDTLTASGKDNCTGVLVTNTATAVCPLLISPVITITRVCPAVPVPAGGLFVFSGSVSNAGDVTLTEVFVVSSQPAPNTPVLGPIELAPGESQEFSGSYVVAAGSDPSLDTVTASGIDIWQARSVTAKANCSGPAIQSAPPVIGPVSVVNGVVTVSWTATSGVTYCLQSRSSLKQSNWTTIPGNVTASGTTASKQDPIGPDTQRLYRVMIVQE